MLHIPEVQEVSSQLLFADLIGRDSVVVSQLADFAKGAIVSPFGFAGQLQVFGHLRVKRAGKELRLSHESCLSVERKRNNRKTSPIKASPAKLFFTSTAAIAAYLNQAVNRSGEVERNWNGESFVAALFRPTLCRNRIFRDPIVG